MAADTQKHQKNSKQKAMALLTLAADPVAVPSICPSDEEMAALIEGRGTENEILLIWTHLGGCDKCYGTWLSLKKNKKQDAPRGRFYYLNSLRKIRYLGAALAAAACITVYLNVVTMEEKVGEQKAAPQAIPLYNKKVAIQPVLPSAAIQEKEEPTRQIPKPSVLKPQEAPQKRAVPQVQQERKAAKDMASDAALPLAESAMAPAVSLGREDGKIFLAELRSACLAGHAESSFWTDMLAQGLRLQAQLSGAQTWPEKQKLTAVLVLIQGINGPDAVPQQCRMILDELAKENGSK